MIYLHSDGTMQISLQEEDTDGVPFVDLYESDVKALMDGLEWILMQKENQRTDSEKKKASEEAK